MRKKKLMAFLLTGALAISASPMNIYAIRDASGGGPKPDDTNQGAETTYSSTEITIPEGLADGIYAGTATVSDEEKEDAGASFADYGITVAVVVKDGAIESIQVYGESTSSEDLHYTTDARTYIHGQLEGKETVAGTYEVDAKTHATCSSKAIIQAINAAFQNGTTNKTFYHLGNAIYNSEGSSFEVTILNAPEDAVYTEENITIAPSLGKLTLKTPSVKGEDYTVEKVVDDNNEGLNEIKFKVTISPDSQFTFDDSGEDITAYYNYPGRYLDVYIEDESTDDNEVIEDTGNENPEENITDDAVVESADDSENTGNEESGRPETGEEGGRPGNGEEGGRPGNSGNTGASPVGRIMITCAADVSIENDQVIVIPANGDDFNLYRENLGDVTISYTDTDGTIVTHEYTAQMQHDQIDFEPEALLKDDGSINFDLVTTDGAKPFVYGENWTYTLTLNSPGFTTVTAAVGKGAPANTAPTDTTNPPAASTTQNTAANTTASAPAKGTKLVETATKATYKVTKAGATGGTVEYTKSGNTAAKTVQIPATVKIGGITYKVTSIAANAFKNNKKITKVTIGKNIITIGKNAFRGCSKLKTVIIKTTKSTNKRVGAKAFAKINAKAKVKVPKAKLKKYTKILKKKGLTGANQKVK